MTIIPASVTILDLASTSVATSTMAFEASYTTASGNATTVQVLLPQIMTTTFGGLPTGGDVGQFLQKNSTTNYAAGWSNIASSFVAGTGITLAGSTTVEISVNTSILSLFSVTAGTSITVTPSGTTFIVGVTDGGIGSTQLGNLAVQRANITAAAIGSAQIDVGAVHSTNLAAGAINFAATALLSSVLIVPFGGIGTTALPLHGVVLGNATSALQVVAATTSGHVLTATGSATAPVFAAPAISTAVASITAGGGLSSLGVGTTNGTISTTGTLTRVVYPSLKTALYTAVTGDLGQVITFSTAALATFVMPQASSTVASPFGPGWFVDLQNSGATAIVIAPVTSNLTGVGATGLLGPNSSVRLISDGTNYIPNGANGLLSLNLRNTNQTFSGGVFLTAFNAGTTSGGTSITFSSGNGPIQFMRNAGTGTLTAPSTDGELDVLVMGTTNASTLTLSGFNATTSAPVGDPYIANATSLFLLSIRRVNGSSTYRWAAYQ